MLLIFTVKLNYDWSLIRLLMNDVVSLARSCLITAGSMSNLDMVNSFVPTTKMLPICAKQGAVIELDFRLPSMLHGKKGFDRIVHAFKHVLNDSYAWLFVDLEHGDMCSGTSSSNTRR
jgi:hypothetical protein